MKIKLHPEAFLELEAARDWYEKEADNLGVDFLDEVDLALKMIRENPKVWPVYYGIQNVHRFLVHRFPFGIIYRYLDEIIEIVAVGHLYRKPGYWKNRLNK